MLTQSLISLVVVGQLSLVIALLAFTRPFTRSHLWAIALMISVVGYALVSNPAISGHLGQAHWIFRGLALLPPYLLWLFATELFELRYLRSPLRALILLIPAVLFAVSVTNPESAGSDWALTLHRAVALLLVVSLLILVLVDHGDDLLHKRRRFRLWFTGLIALQSGAILIVELSHRGAVPDYLELINIVAIGVLVLSLAVPLFKTDAAVLWQDDEPKRESVLSLPRDEDASSAPVTSRAEDALISALTALMAQGYYTQTGLSIKQLADELNTPEHTLRATINQVLGYRNFSSFLNTYRIQSAQARLSDPKLRRTPILTIALEVGYGSIGPFNRAFKAITGVTPSEYRQTQLKS